jgi:hypothetical protein
MLITTDAADSHALVVPTDAWKSANNTTFDPDDLDFCV